MNISKFTSLHYVWAAQDEWLQQEKVRGISRAPWTLPSVALQYKINWHLLDLLLAWRKMVRWYLLKFMRCRFPLRCRQVFNSLSFMTGMLPTCTDLSQKWQRIKLQISDLFFPPASFGMKGMWYRENSESVMNYFHGAVMNKIEKSYISIWRENACKCSQLLARTYD